VKDPEDLKTRDQRIVKRLQESLAGEQTAAGLDAFRSRALDLPTMLRRNGLMHTLLFLAGKKPTDVALARVLRAGIAAGLNEHAEDEPSAYARDLAGVDLSTYLLHWEVAVETAAWLKLLVEADHSERTVGGAGVPAQ
jgi:CRISPR type III-B/RAMP module-associated protein Cmr5